MNELRGQRAHLLGLNKLNIILGRNGSGKSRFLRDLEKNLSQQKENYNVRYISPERAGSFKREGSILTNMTDNPNWLRETRSFNQVNNFKSTSAVLFRELETLYLRRLAKSPEIRKNLERNFETDRLSIINSLLTNVSLKMGATDYEFHSLVTGQTIRPDEISSGESEVVSLSTEILYFFETLDLEKLNILLIDEPDVHLHPDLQARLGRMILALLDEFKNISGSIFVCIATHSTPFVCSLAQSLLVSIGTKEFEVDTVELRVASKQLRKVAPFFGHPISLSLSDDAPLIIEGEDDERVWQQAARTSRGILKYFPVVSGSVDHQNELELLCSNLIKSLYDHPVAFSIRDGDNKAGASIEHIPPLKRYRLQCYAIENALLTDDCLTVMCTTWDDFIGLATAWLAQKKDHPDASILQTAISSKDRSRYTKIKNIRQLICSIANCNKPWEVVVGQTIGKLAAQEEFTNSMLVDFLGEPLTKDVILRHQSI